MVSESFFRLWPPAENKKQRGTESAASKGGEPSGLDALANAAVLGESVADAGDNSAAATTKHPRHRPGCTCIVCIQPPSGKGKHEPSCKCNVCLTVRRRFKTLMMRKKKKQSDREEKEKEDSRAAKEDIAGMALLDMNNPGNETGGGGGNGDQPEESSRGGGLDLNCDPRREDEILAESSAAFTPVDVFAGQNGE